MFSGENLRGLAFLLILISAVWIGVAYFNYPMRPVHESLPNGVRTYSPGVMPFLAPWILVGVGWVAFSIGSIQSSRYRILMCLTVALILLVFLPILKMTTLGQRVAVWSKLQLVHSEHVKKSKPSLAKSQRRQEYPRIHGYLSCCLASLRLCERFFHKLSAVLTHV